APRGVLSEEIWRELSARKDELREWLEGLYERQVARREVARPALQAQARSEHLPLSYAQQRLWFIDQLEGGASTEYNMPEALRLLGPLDPAALERALNTIVARHESLRTRFGQQEGQPVQLIAPALSIPLPLEDLSALEPAAQQQAVAASLRQEW